MTKPPAEEGVLDSGSVPGATSPPRADEYVAGVCNIGPAEIARRRRVGHGGVAVTAMLLAILAVSRATRPWRLLAAIPAAVAASGYLQAAHHFCANFGWRGVFNFGDLGPAERVEDAGARAADRRQALRIGLESLAFGLGVGLVSLVPKGGRRR